MPADCKHLLFDNDIDNMIRKFAFMGICTLLAVSAMAQQQRTVNVQGMVLDYETNEPIPQTTIQWLQLPDSAFVEGVVTFNNGHYELQKRVRTGNYILKVSYIGYGTQELPFAVDKRTESIQMDTVRLKSDAIMLKEAIIEAQIAEVQMVEDTLMFNAEAFRVPEGSVIEELLKKLPGVEVSDDGSITVNGRTVDKLLVGGEEFFGNNRELTMKNLPANIVKRVKNYERKSDLSRETGIDDGEEEFVLDLEVKRNMMQGWIGNFDGAYGQPLRSNDFDVRDLYSGRIMMNRFERKQQYSVFANTGNTGGNVGLNQNTSAGFNMAKNFGEEWRKVQYQYKVGGNANFSTGGSHNENESSSETILNEMNSTFSNNWNTNANSNLRASGDFQFEWRPDSMTSLIIRPNFNYNQSGSTSASKSATFNEDPYATIDRLYDLDEDDLQPLDSAWTDASRINWARRESNSENESTSVNASIQFTRRMNTEGRNLTLRANGGYTEGQSYSRSNSFTRFYQRNDSTSIINRFNSTPSLSYNMSGRVMYSEPLALATYLQLSYQLNYSYRDNRRSTYNLPAYIPNWEEPEWLWEDSYEQWKSDSLSRFSRDENINQDITVQLRRVTDKYNLNVGLSLLPQTRKMNQQYMGHDIDTTRTVFNWTPTLNYRYRFTKQRSLRANYRGRSSQPELTQLIDITDDSDPMNITRGNPGLKPTFNNSLRLEYQDSNAEKLSGTNASLNMGNTLNSIVQKTIYNEETGGRISQPTNLDGFWSNWNISGNFSYNTALKNQHFTVSTGTRASYQHHESYLRTGSIEQYGGEYPLATTHSMNFGETLNGRYRNDWMDVGVRGSFNYNYALNEVQPDLKQSTWSFNYGPETNMDIPWQNIKLNTSITMNSRRGYSDPTYNTNELIWNATVSKSFLAQNAATLQLQFFDILGQRSDVNRNVTATGHSDSKSMNIHSYFLAHFIYRLNLIGDKQARQDMRMARPMGGGDYDGERGGRGGGFGGPGGGFGGGRGPM